MKYLIIILTLLIGEISIAQNFNQNKIIKKPEIEDTLQPALDYKLNNFVGNKLDLSYQNRILAQDIDRLVFPFQNRNETSCWQSEFWGKWMMSAMQAYNYKPMQELKDSIVKAVNELMLTQSTDGYIGNYTEKKRLEGWDIWGRKYCMLGLLAYYYETGSIDVLKSLQEQADCLINELQDKNVMIVKKGSHRGMAATSILQPICLLYNYTGIKKYLDFAEEIVSQWETTDGPQLISKANFNVSERFQKPLKNWYGWEQGQKAYEMMSCYEGLLELYRITGKKEYLKAVEQTYQNILNTEINIVGSGSSMECWFDGKKFQALPILNYQETCVTVSWLRLSLQLLKLTGEAKYADDFERTYYNALLGAMKPDGSSWAQYTPILGYRSEGHEQCGMGLNCCIANGPRGLFSFPANVIMTRSNGIQVNFFSGGTFSLYTPSKQRIKIIQDTNYPINGKIELNIELQDSEKMALYIRIPKWSKQSQLFVNGESIQDVVAGQYVILNKVWNNGDKINIELDMRGRIHKIGDHLEYLAIKRGPIVLARDSRLSDSYIDGWLTPYVDKNGYIDLELITKKQRDFWMLFKIRCNDEYSQKKDKQSTLVLCDYASSGNSYDIYSRFRVWFLQIVNPMKIDFNNDSQ